MWLGDNNETIQGQFQQSNSYIRKNMDQHQVSTVSAVKFVYQKEYGSTSGKYYSTIG
jgi:hypothetical protein